MPDAPRTSEAGAPHTIPARRDDRVSQLALKLVAANARLNALVQGRGSVPESEIRAGLLRLLRRLSGRPNHL